MSLAAYIPRSETVLVADTSFSVRGLSVTDIGALIENNLDELTLLVDSFKGKEQFDESEIALAVAQLPRVAVAMIAMASTEDADLAQLAASASRLPLSVQVDAVCKIGKLTFEDAGGLGKFAANLKMLFGQIRKDAPPKK